MSVNRFQGIKFSELYNSGGGDSGGIIYKGAISIPADFPLPASDPNGVKLGWEYSIEQNVTDNDPSKTNTGQSFQLGALIIWNGTTWSAISSENYWADNGDNLSPVNVRGINIPSEKTISINNADVIKYQSSNPTTITTGGIPAGTNLYGMPANEILNKILEPFIAPTFSAFSISGIPAAIEVGNKITGSHTFSWSFTNGSLITDNTLDIVDTIIPYNIATDISKISPLIFDFSTLPGGGIDLTVAGTYTWTIRADYTHPINGLTTINRNYVTAFQYPKFSGSNSSQSLTNAQILALTKTLSNTGLGTYSFAGNGYFHLYVEESLPQPTYFKDQATGFSIDISNVGIVAVTTDYGLVENFNHYVSQNYLVSSFTVIAT